MQNEYRELNPSLVNEIWLKPIGLTTEYSPSILNNVVFLPAKEVDTTGPGYGFYGSIVLSFSTGVLSLPFTSSPPQSNTKQCDISGKGPECWTIEGALPYSMVPFEHFQNDSQWAHARAHMYECTYTHTHRRARQSRKTTSVSL